MDNCKYFKALLFPANPLKKFTSLRIICFVSMQTVL